MPSPKELDEALTLSADRARRMAEAFGLKVPGVAPKPEKHRNSSAVGYWGQIPINSVFDNSVTGKATLIATQEGDNLQIKEPKPWLKLQKLLTTC